MKKTTVYLPDEQDRATKALARAQGRSQAEVIRDAIARFVNAASVRPASVGAGRGPGGGSVADLEAEWLAEFGRR
jgi:predicted transcriptional regulator